MTRSKLVPLLLVVFLIFTACTTSAQPETFTGLPKEIPAEWSGSINSITHREISAEISYLASEELEGRRSQTEGSRLAGEFIADHLRSLGLKPLDEDYFQEFKFENLRNYLQIKQRLEKMEEYGYSVPKNGRNVAGILEGSGKKDEYIVLVTHRDHMGFNPERGTGEMRMNLGADDNASGTAALMEIAEAFALLAEEGTRPQRSIIFLFADAEEWGLLGSQYFAENPPVPLENIVAAMNMDMLGRNKGNVVDVIATPLIDDAPKKTPDLYRASKEAAEVLGIELNLPGDEGRKEEVFYRSDHYSFFKNSAPTDRMPVIFYTAGLHNDYHTSRDTADKIDNKKVATIAQFIFLVALKVSEMENVPDYVE